MPVALEKGMGRNPLKLEGIVTEATNALFQSLVGGGYNSVGQFDGAHVDPPKNPKPDRWLGIVPCVEGPKNRKADAHEVWAIGLIEYQRDKSDQPETSRLVAAMKALGIDLEEVLNEGSRYETFRVRVMKDILGEDFDPKNPHAKDVDRVGIITEKGLDWMYENTEFGLLSQDDQLVVIDWYTRADAFNGEDLPDRSDPAYQDRQTKRLQEIIVPLREAVERHCGIHGLLDDQQRLGQSVFAKAGAHEEKARDYETSADFAEKRADKREKQAKKYDEEGLTDKAADMRGRAAKFRQEAADYRQKAAEERKQGAPLFQVAVEIDPTNVAAQRAMAFYLIGKGDHQKAKAHLAQAVTHEKDPNGFAKTVALAQYVKDPDIGNGWDFVIGRLEKENRMEEAAAVSKQGYGNPHYFPLPSSPSGKVHQALLKAGIRPNEISKAGGPVTVRDLWAYVGNHFQDSKVCQALKAAGVPMPWLDERGDVKPEFAGLDKIKFGELLATHYSEKAAGANDAREKERALILAIHYQPGKSDHYVALGDLYFSHQAYEAALEAYQASGLSEAGSLGAGRCHFMMGDLPAARDAYTAYLPLDSRSAEIRTARLEVNLMRLTKGEAAIEDIGAEILQDQSMLRFLNPAADRDDLKTLSTDLDPEKVKKLGEKAKEFLLLGRVEHERSENTEELALHYSGLAAEAYRTLDAWASKSSDIATREMAYVYRANALAAEGNMEEAEKSYQALIDEAAPRFVFGHQYIGDTDVEKGRHALDRILWKKQGEKMVVEGNRLIEEGTQTGDQSKVARGKRMVEDGKYKVETCHAYTEEPSPALLEALAKLDAIEGEKTRSFNLAALDFWEGIVEEQAKIEKEGDIKWDWHSVNGTVKMEFRFNADTERRLIGELRDRMRSRPDLIKVTRALSDIAAYHEDPELRAYASNYLAQGGDDTDSRPPTIVGYLLRYADDGFPPRKDSAEDLLAIAYKVDKKGHAAVAVGAYQFVAAFSSEKDIQDQAEKRIRLATGDGGFWETVDEIGNRTFGGDTPDEMAENLMVNFVVLGGVGKVGTVARLATANRLRKSGAAAWKVWAYSRGAGAVAGGTAFFLYGTHQELQNGNPDEVLSVGHLARRWGASVVLMSFAEFGGGAGSVAGRNQVAQWAVTHAGSFTGMVAGGYANRFVGLEDGSLADWAPLAGAIALYPAYAAGGALMGTPRPARNAVSLRGVNEARLFFGLEGEITPETVNRAYRGFKQRHHSDKLGGRQADHGLLSKADALRAYLLRDVCGQKLSNAQDKMANDYITSLQIASAAQPEKASSPANADAKPSPAKTKPARPPRGNWRFQAGAIRIPVKGSKANDPLADTQPGVTPVKAPPPATNLPIFSSRQNGGKTENVLTVPADAKRVTVKDGNRGTIDLDYQNSSGLYALKNNTDRPVYFRVGSGGQPREIAPGASNMVPDYGKIRIGNGWYNLRTPSAADVKNGGTPTKDYNADLPQQPGDLPGQSGEIPEGGKTEVIQGEPTVVENGEPTMVDTTVPEPVDPLESPRDPSPVGWDKGDINGGTHVGRQAARRKVAADDPVEAPKKAVVKEPRTAVEDYEAQTQDAGVRLAESYLTNPPVRSEVEITGYGLRIYVETPEAMETVINGLKAEHKAISTGTVRSTKKDVTKTLLVNMGDAIHVVVEVEVAPDRRSFRTNDGEQNARSSGELDSVNTGPSAKAALRFIEPFLTHADMVSFTVSDGRLVVRSEQVASDIFQSARKRGMTVTEIDGQEGHYQVTYYSGPRGARVKTPFQVSVTIDPTAPQRGELRNYRSEPKGEDDTGPGLEE